MPPTVQPKFARSIKIEDIDRGVKRWFDSVLDARVSSDQGDRRKVTVKFASGERWVAAADQQGIRDRDGRLILPIIQIHRTEIDPINNKTALGANVPRMQVSVLVSEKTSQLAGLDLLRPISQRRLRDSAVYDIYTIPFPSNNNFNFKVLIQVQYQQQMNEIVEKLLSKLEFFNVPSFVISLSTDVREKGIKTGDGSTEMIPEGHAIYDAREPLDDYYVVGYIDGPLTDQGNSDDFTDQERIIQLGFSFTVPTVLMLDPEGTRPAVQRERTAFLITMVDEEVHEIEDSAQADRIFGKK